MAVSRHYRALSNDEATRQVEQLEGPLEELEIRHHPSWKKSFDSSQHPRTSPFEAARYMTTEV